jgi:hypothetical protein
MDKVYLGYTPNDFYWVSADFTDVNCADVSNLYCDNSLNAQECYNYELCNNKKNALYLSSIQTNNSGFDERIKNKKQEYKTNFTNTMNLGAGILFLSVFIFMNKDNLSFKR